MKEILRHFPSEILEQAAERYGTPLYLYSEKLIERQADTYINAFKKIPTIFCYAMKANSCGKFCSVLARKGFGADAVSGGEIFRALRAEFPAERIVFSGTGKTEAELEYAARSGILFINAENAEELRILEEICRRTESKCRISVRVNPEVDPHTHKYISTGMYGSKFGVSFSDALEMYCFAARSEWLVPVGVHFHIGSQISSAEPYILAAEKIRSFITEIEAKTGISLEYADIGGGWGAVEGEEMPDPAAILPAAEMLSASGKKIILEPGRSISAPCGILLAKVLYIKKSGGRNIIITDCGMNDFVRPALYGAEHPVIAVGNCGKTMKYDIAGPVCESSDFVARNVELPEMRRGDLIAILSAGAYGFSMSSNYNSRPRAAEAIISGSEIILARRRESFEDIIMAENR